MNRLAPVLMLAACATSGVHAPDRTAQIEITSANWYASTVRVYCETGGLLAIMRGIEMGSQVRKRFDPRTCTSVYLVVEGAALRAYRHPAYLPIAEGSTLCGTIAPFLHHSWFVNCKR